MTIDLRYGDTIEQMKLIPNKSIDFICCDLPYGTTACAWDIVIPFEKLWEQYKRIIKDKGVIVLFGSEPFSSLLRTSNLDWYKYDWIWEKNNAGNFQLVNYQPLKIHETISVFYNETPNMEFANIMVENMKRLNLKQIDVSKLEYLSFLVFNIITISSNDVFPALSPIPFIVHSTCVAPASTAANEFATAIPKSLWQ